MPDSAGSVDADSLTTPVEDTVAPDMQDITSDAAFFRLASNDLLATEIGIAEWFAKSNPAGNPAIYAFELSEAVIQALVNSAAKAVFAHAAGAGIDYEFLPASFAVVNQHMGSRSVVTLP